MAKEDGDAKEIVNGNGTVDSSNGSVSEEQQNSSKDHITDTTSTSEATPNETKNNADQDNNTDSKFVENGSNDENTTNIIESINDAMKENDEVTHDNNIEIIIKEECCDIQEKDVLVEEIILEDTSIEHDKEPEPGNSEHNEDISSEKQINVAVNDLEYSVVSENVLVEQKEETIGIGNDSAEVKIECLSENNAVDANGIKEETVDTSSNSNITDLQTEENEEEMEVSGSIELGGEQKEAPNESKILDDDKGESSTENNFADVNGTNIKIDDALSISKSSELKAQYEEGSIEISGSIELEDEQNNEITKINNALEDNKVESLTENNVINVDEIKNEADDSLPNSKTLELQTEEKEEGIERSCSIEPEAGQEEETFNVCNVSEDGKVEVLTENNEDYIIGLKNEADKNVPSPKISELQSTDQGGNIEIGDSVVLDVNPKEESPKVSIVLEGDQVESLSETNIYDANETNIVTEDTLSISKTSELQIDNKEETIEDVKVESLTKNLVTDFSEVNNDNEYALSGSKPSESLTGDQEEKIETSGSSKTDPKQNEENLTVTNVSESEKIESSTESYEVDPKEVKIETDDRLSSSKTSELQTEDNEENIEISGSIEIEADQLFQQNEDCVPSKTQEQTSVDDKMIPSEEQTEELCSDKSIPSDQENDNLIEEKNHAECSDATIQDRVDVEEGFTETVFETLDNEKILLSSNTEQQLSDNAAESVDIPTKTETLVEDVRIVESIDSEEKSPVTDLSEAKSNDLCTNEEECTISEVVKDDNQSQNQDSTKSKEIEITSDLVLESSVSGNIQEPEVPDNSIISPETKKEVSTSNPSKVEEDPSDEDVNIRRLSNDQEKILPEDTQDRLDLSAPDEPVTESIEENESLRIVAEDIPCGDENEKIDELSVKTPSFESQNSDLSPSNIIEENKTQITIDVEEEEKDVEVVEHDWDIATEVVQRSSEEDEEQCIGAPVSQTPAFMTEVLSSSDVESQDLVKKPEIQVLDSEIKVEEISETNLQLPHETNETTIKETRIEENVTNELIGGKDLTVAEEAIATTKNDVFEKSGKSLQSRSALHSSEPLKPSKGESKKGEDNSNVVAVVAAVLAIAIGMIIYHMFNKK